MFRENPTSDSAFIKREGDKYNKGLKNKNKTEYNMIVDYSLFIQISVNIKDAKVVSIDNFFG